MSCFATVQTALQPKDKIHPNCTRKMFSVLGTY